MHTYCILSCISVRPRKQLFKPNQDTADGQAVAVMPTFGANPAGVNGHPPPSRYTFLYCKTFDELLYDNVILKQLYYVSYE